jgi:hypothetical protein
MIKLLFIIIFPGIVFTQTVQEQFVSDYLNNKDILKYADANEISRSERLGVSYDSIHYKFLISYDTDKKIKMLINNNEVNCRIMHNDLENGYKQTSITIDSLHYKCIFTFKDSKLVDNFSYYSKDWKTIESKYFIFKISDSTNFNLYCQEQLDSNVDSLCAFLQITGDNKIKLEREKIYYYLLKDEEELDKLGEYKSGGYYSPDYDEIVTYTRAHYHEVAHALITYKLRKQKLLTHPFIREGFAVATGGTILYGKYNVSKSAALDFAFNTYKEGLVDIDSIFTLRGFAKYDFVGVSYPICGLYNQFLMQNFNLEDYLNMYRENSSGINNYIDYFKIKYLSASFDSFLKERKNSIIVTPDSSYNNNNTQVITEENDEYFFNVNGTIFLTPKNEPSVNFRSLIFSSEFPDIQYRGERYYIFTNKYVIEIADLYLDIIIAKYLITYEESKIEKANLKVLSGFKIRKSFFNGNLLNDYIISQTK